MTMMSKLDLAIIGGTGLYALADLQDVETHQPVTRYGAPSGPMSEPPAQAASIEGRYRA